MWFVQVYVCSHSGSERSFRCAAVRIVESQECMLRYHSICQDPPDWSISSISSSTCFLFSTPKKQFVILAKYRSLVVVTYTLLVLLNYEPSGNYNIHYYISLLDLLC